MSAEQCAVDFTDGALAELVAEGGIDRLITRHDHQPGRAEIQTVYQRAAWILLNQPIVYRIEILWIFP